MIAGFPRSIYAMTDSLIRKAMPLMKAYKRRDMPSQKVLLDDSKFDRERPYFVRVWGYVEPGKGGDQIEMHATMTDETMIELLAIVGCSDSGYPMMMPKAQFQREYEID